MSIPVISAIKIDRFGGDASRLATLAAPSLAIVASVLIVLFVVWPKFNEVLKLRSSNKQLLELSSKLEAKAQTLSEVDKDKLVSEIGVADQILPSDKGIFTLIRQIEAAAGSSGILVNRLEVAPGGVSSASSPVASQTPPAASSPSQVSGEQAVDASKVQVRISISGDYKSFLQFISNLYALPRVVSLQSLGVSGSGQSSQIGVSFGIDAYWQSIPSALGSIESPVETITQGEEAVLTQAGNGSSGQPSAPVLVPAVPIGRPDLFAPY